MTSSTTFIPTPGPPSSRASPFARAATGAGRWLAAHGGTVRAVQWVVVAVYATLLVGPVLLPLPDRTAHLWSNLTLFAQFAFWGVWWPFVLLSMVLVGRTWCGVFCPEGALTEWTSRWSLGRHVPRWITWGGWPFTAFVLTTVYGQMISVYGYPGPALVVLGGSTLGAMAVGLVYGRNKRVWCRYLCPVNGVFAALAKLAPVAFRADEAAWHASRPPFRAGRDGAAFNCAPLVAVRQMRGAGACHMCGRCQDFRGAVGAVVRSPNHDVVSGAGVPPSRWDSALLVFGMVGVALGAFRWSGSAAFVSAKQRLAEWLLERGWDWALAGHLPWWVLTNYPAQNDVMTPLDGAVLLGFVAATALATGGAMTLGVSAAAVCGGGWSERRCHELAQALIPVAGAGLFLGLSATTVGLLKADGIAIPGLGATRAALLGGAALWSCALAWGVVGRWWCEDHPGTTRRLAGTVRRAGATALMAVPVAIATYGWASLFWRL